MTGFEHSIRPKKPSNNKKYIDFVFLGQVADLTKALKDCFPKKTTLGQKYLKSGINMYENTQTKAI